MARLETQHPNATTELLFSNAYQLLVATILSAQTTDERVNQVTPALFRKYPDARALAAARPEAIEPLVQPTGFFRAKSRSILGMAREVVARFGGEVPARMEDLVTLPGVGRKTANVVLGHAFRVPGIAVDRHVLRVSNRIGLACSEDPLEVESQLCASLPSEMWTLTSSTLILHGRRICKSRPLCEQCAVTADCNYFQTVVSPQKTERANMEPTSSAGAPGDLRSKARTLRKRRAPQARGTGRGGGAPRQTKK